MKKLFISILLTLSLASPAHAALVKYGDTVQDRYGKVISSATVEVVATGTTTAATLYSDSAGSTVKSANGTTLTDTNGYYWFYIPEGRYDITVSKTNFTTQTTTDIYISGATVGTAFYTSSYASLNAAQTAAAAVTGGHVIVDKSGTTLTGNTTVTVPLTVQGGTINQSTYTLTINGPFSAPLAPVFTGSGAVTFGSAAINWNYLEWYGGKGDGSTVNDTSFSTALTAYPRLKLLKGSYKITTGNIAVPTYAVIEGSGMYETLILNDSSTGDTFKITGTASPYKEYVEIRNMTITSSSTTTGDAIDATYTRYGTIENVAFRNHNKGIYSHTNCYYNTIKNCLFTQIAQYSVHENNFGANYFVGNRFDGNGSDVTDTLLYIDSASHMTMIIGNTFSGPAVKGIEILGACKGTVITGNSFSEITTNAISIVDYSGNYPTGTVISGNSFRNMASISDAVIRLNAGGRYTQISGNTFIDNHATNPDIKIDVAAAYTNIIGNITNDTTFLSDSDTTTVLNGNVDSTGKIIGPVKYADPITFTDQDTTPSVKNGNIFRTANTGATVITGFDDGQIGQMITIRLGDAFTDFTDSATLELEGNANFTTGLAGDTITFLKLTATAWIEVSRSIHN